MRILIVDDEKPARDRLKRLVGNLPEHEAVGEARNGHEAVERALELQPDLILMDIRMPGMDGIEAAKQLLNQEQPPAIIFTTAFADHALEAFEAKAVDYLLKPVKLDRLQKALESSRQLNRAQLRHSVEEVEQNEARQHICARVRGNLVLVPLTDIYYFQAEQKYVTVRHTEGELLIEEPLKSLEQEFHKDFYRIHRNALVRLDKIAGMRNHQDVHQVFFHDIDDLLDISRRHLPGVRKILKSL